MPKFVFQSHWIEKKKKSTRGKRTCKLWVITAWNWLLSRRSNKLLRVKWKLCVTINESKLMIETEHRPHSRFPNSGPGCLTEQL